MSTPSISLIGRRFLAETMRDAGIETVFTVAGGHFLPTYHEMGQIGAPRVVAARHEQGAGYMASGYALATGRPGVVLSGAPGPGATNLVTPVANAFADSVPLLVLSAQVDRRYVHRNILQYCDNVGLFGPFCKSSTQAVSLEEVPNLIATGMQLACSGRPGPVHIALPQNLQADTTSARIPLQPLTPRPAKPAESDIDALIEKLTSSRRPAVLAGHGVIRSGGTRDLVGLAEWLGTPVATSRSGIGSIPTDHRCSVGMLGFYGTEAARGAVAEADMVLIVGCAMGEQTTFGWRPTLFSGDGVVAQIDADASQINRVYDVDVGVVADAATTLSALRKRIESAGASRNTWFAGHSARTEPQNDPNRGLSAADVMRSLNAHLPDDAVVSADIGNHRLWVCEQLDVRRANGLLQSCEFDAMGFSLPAAIGATVGLGSTKTVSISGDGGFVHTMGELVVAQELGVPVVAIVFVDGALGILKHQAEEMYGEHHFVQLAPIDFEALANSFGLEARTVDRIEDLDETLRWAMTSDRPVLLAVNIDPDEVFPPLRTKIEQRKIDLLGES